MPGYEAVFEFRESSVIDDALATVVCESVIDSNTTLKVAKRRVTVSVEAPDKNEALVRATALVERFRRLTIMKIGHPISRLLFLGLGRVDGGAESILPSLLVTWSVVSKQPEEMRQDAKAAVEGCRVDHADLDKAAAYFERGVYATLESKGKEPDLTSMAFDAVDGILNFYKALELLLGEDHPQQGVLGALEPDHARRRILWRRLDEVYELRYHYDVGHARPDWTRLEELRNRAGRCREATSDVLQLYLGALERGDQVPAPVKQRNFDGTSTGSESRGPVSGEVDHN